MIMGRRKMGKGSRIFTLRAGLNAAERYYLAAAKRRETSFQLTTFQKAAM